MMSHASKAGKSAFLFSMAVILPSSALAAPSVTSLSTQTPSHNQAVTVSGSGFGIKSPVAPLLWDPVFGQPAYAGLADGSVVPKGTGKPWPVMSGSGTVPPLYKTSNPRGKSLACYSNYANGHWSPFTNISTDYGQAVVGNVDYSSSCSRSRGGTGKLYISWWAYPYGRTNFHAADKFIRINPQGQFVTATYVNMAQGAAQLFDFSLGTMAYVYFNQKLNPDAWNRLECAVDNNVSPRPRVALSTNTATVSDVTASAPGLSADLCGIPDLGADFSNDPDPIKLDFGEIYIDSTPARVEICDSSTWTSRTHCEIQIPKTTWLDNQIEITMNQGSFANGVTAYLYVLDANGVPSNGQKLTFFGLKPSAPKNVNAR